MKPAEHLYRGALLFLAASAAFGSIGVTPRPEYPLVLFTVFCIGWFALAVWAIRARK